jgi:glycosyltransferase involved in cell wall biosynthesis
MKILINTMSLGKGGAERVIVNLSNYFVTNHYETTIVSAINSTPKYNIPESVIVQYLDRKKPFKIKSRYIRFLRRRAALKRLLRKSPPDLIISFLPEPNFILLSLEKYFSIPIIISVRNDPKQEYSNKIFYLAMRYLYPKADGFVFQTDNAKEYFNFSQKISNSASVIPNPVDGKLFSNRFKMVRKKEIVSVGRLVVQKNQYLLIKAFSLLGDMFNAYTLLIYGEGPLRQKLEKYIMELDMADRINLVGEKEDLYELIRMSSLFVLSSDYEGMPNSLIEAMCLGLPVIATNCPSGGPRYLIQNGVNGLLCEVNNPIDLKQKMETVLSDPVMMDNLGCEAHKLIDKLDSQKNGVIWTNYINQVYNNYF